MNSLTERIKDEAYRLGFDLVRITSAESLPKAKEAIDKSIGQGYMSGMDWFTSERAKVSTDPTALLPDARSVISLGTFYLTHEPEDRSEPGAPRGRVSSYAWGDDYHDIIKDRLKQLATFIQQQGDGAPHETRLFVDTGRMVDRAIAERSGLGWYGKNTNILTKEWGSWIFLSEIVCNLELEADKPLGSNCGKCEVCLHACPTNAFVAPYVLDATRCISFLTIELRGSIPLELRPLIGNHIFGCDICQAVCPVNKVVLERMKQSSRWIEVQNRTDFQPRTSESGNPDLLELLELDEEQFRERFRNSPIKRTKRRGLLRNVCVALGNSKDPVAVPALTKALHDAEPLVRGHAAWALGQIGGQQAEAVLRETMESETETEVLGEIRYALEVVKRL